ncbi:MAG: hypothetical protein M9930_12290 [Anaerolineae bacterium]|nr:hypothetical protein [Anaerolineae bacterium]
MNLVIGAIFFYELPLPLAVLGHGRYGAGVAERIALAGLSVSRLIFGLFKSRVSDRNPAFLIEEPQRTVLQ